MKVSVKKDKVIFESQTGMDLFWLGVISSKNSNICHWEHGTVKSMTMSKQDVIIGLGCKRDK